MCIEEKNAVQGSSKRGAAITAMAEEEFGAELPVLSYVLCAWLVQ